MSLRRHLRHHLIFDVMLPRRLMPSIHSASFFFYAFLISSPPIAAAFLMPDISRFAAFFFCCRAFAIRFAYAVLYDAAAAAVYGCLLIQRTCACASKHYSAGRRQDAYAARATTKYEERSILRGERRVDAPCDMSACAARECALLFAMRLAICATCLR